MSLYSHSLSLAKKIRFFLKGQFHLNSGNLLRPICVAAGLVALINPIYAHAYADCWTSYFNPGDYAVAYDDSGVRYIGGLPAGVTCGCTINNTTIWISGANKKGSTGATLAAAMASKQVRFLLHEENTDGYCRSSIVEIKPN